MPLKYKILGKVSLHILKNYLIILDLLLFPCENYFPSFPKHYWDVDSNQFEFIDFLMENLWLYYI